MTTRLGPVTLGGTGLHSGEATSVTFAPVDGPLVFRTEHGEARLADLAVVRADHGVCVRCERIGLDVDSVEHLLAALGGLSMKDGIALSVASGEVPLMDGAALAFARALTAFASPQSRTNTKIVRAGSIEIGTSTYVFEPSAASTLDVEIAFAEPGIGVERAHWDGTPGAFLKEIAWARTFGFRRDAERLRAAGRAFGVDPRAVMVLDERGHVERPGEPAQQGEFARHKLLDLIGDLYLFGGPPRGQIRATRPGHAATHSAMAEALRTGLVRHSERSNSGSARTGDRSRG